MDCCLNQNIFFQPLQPQQEEEEKVKTVLCNPQSQYLHFFSIKSKQLAKMLFFCFD